ncbi:hypothetical protein [Litchfieldia alkalitelluris]|uniref:hypothetical protein n=1 Tax=Litchfieldia alkalitelluris TaxID=304268 RepID=UPI0009983EEC|nr:hypothetical protein [Litchfieldia alkalitelluris]
MKSTKYQLLKGDYDFVCRELKQRREMIEELRKENEVYRKALKLVIQNSTSGHVELICKKALGHNENCKICEGKGKPPNSDYSCAYCGGSGTNWRNQ